MTNGNSEDPQEPLDLEYEYVFDQGKAVYLILCIGTFIYPFGVIVNALNLPSSTRLWVLASILAFLFLVLGFPATEQLTEESQKLLDRHEAQHRDQP